MRRRGPDSLEGCFTALIIFLISTLTYGTAGLSSMLFVACITRFNTDRNKASFPFVLSYVMQAATGPFAGYFAKRFGDRSVLVTGSVLSFVGIGTCFLAESITMVSVCWGVVFGLGFGFSTLLLPAIINNFFYRHRSKALSACYLGSAIGFLIFPPAVEVLLNKFGLSGTFLLLCGINMQSLPLSCMLRKPTFTGADPELKDNSLKSANKLGSSSSACSVAVQQIHLFQTDMKTDNCNVLFPRRYSLEFLWYDGPSPQESGVRTKQRMLNLNRKGYGTYGEIYQCARSYERSNTGYCQESDRTCKDDEKSVKSGLNCTRETANTSVTVVGTERTKRKMLRSEAECEAYGQFSTIYFGTYQQPRDSHGTNSRCSQPPNALASMNSQTGNFINNCNPSARDNHVNSTSSLSPLVTDSGQKVAEPSKHHRCNDCEYTKNEKHCRPSTSIMSIYSNPVFILMSIVNALYNLHFSAVTTVILDFARDHGTSPHHDKFIMMGVSLTGVCGMVGFGWVTDGGYMSRCRFLSVLLLIGSVCVSVLPATVGFTPLMVVLSLWCLSQSSSVVLIPAIIAENFDEDSQAIAVSACNVLCAPLYFIIPPLIGYFRDNRGSYDGIFYLLSGLAVLNSLLVFIVQYTTRTKKLIECTRL